MRVAPSHKRNNGFVGIMLTFFLTTHQGVAIPSAPAKIFVRQAPLWKAEALSSVSLASPHMQQAIAKTGHVLQPTFGGALQATKPTFLLLLRLREHYQAQQPGGPEHDPSEGRTEVRVQLTLAQKMAMEEIQKNIDAYLAYITSRMPPNRNIATQVITQFWDDTQKMGIFTLPVPLQQMLIDHFAEHANPFLEPHDLLVYHDEQDGHMTLAPFRIIERRLLDPAIDSWAFGV